MLGDETKLRVIFGKAVRDHRTVTHVNHMGRETIRMLARPGQHHVAAVGIDHGQ